MQNQQRLNMVEGQLRPNKINNPQLLAQFTRLPREQFTPAAAQAQAYLDQPLPLGNGREMFSPMVAARLIQELHVTPESHVLIIAGNTGYSAAILAGLAAHVTVQEDDATLLKTAKSHLEDFANVTFISGGLDKIPTTPVDAILIDSTVATLAPFRLAVIGHVLKEGGHAAAVRLGSDGLPEAITLTKHGKSLIEEVLFETKSTPHPTYKAEDSFVF